MIIYFLETTGKAHNAVSQRAGLLHVLQKVRRPCFRLS